jgi:Predicted membrane protein (DUF2306)
MEKTLQKETHLTAQKALSFSVKLWFIIATLGQWIFAFYILAFYGKSSVNGQFEKWNDVLPHGYDKTDPFNNWVVGIHLLFAFIMVVGGPLQIIPQIRERFPKFHRYLGRVFIPLAVLMALDGLTMRFMHGFEKRTFQSINISIQAITIIIFAISAYKTARKRDFINHKIWAIRLFLVVSGVWFFRVGLMGWILIMGSPVGIDMKAFDGPFLWFLSFFVYTLPIQLIVFEMILYAQKAKNKGFTIFTTITVFLFTIIMSIGIAGATMGLWLPRI